MYLQRNCYFCWKFKIGLQQIINCMNKCFIMHESKQDWRIRMNFMIFKKMFMSIIWKIFFMSIFMLRIGPDMSCEPREPGLGTFLVNKL